MVLAAFWWTFVVISYFQGEIHPVKSLNKPKFAKPKGPSKAGAKRITKTPVNPS